MTRLRGRSQNRESPETCPAGAGAAFQRKHFGAAKARPRLIGWSLALVTLLVYLPVCRCNFLVYDDNDYVTENQVVQNGLTWAGVKWAFTTWHAGNWHPLTWLSHMLDCELFGLNPGAQHLVNVLFHAANTVLLFVLLLRLAGSLWPGALVAALFAWHPLHVESVAWISERKDVLSTFFALLALLAYARFAETLKVQGSKFKVFYGLALVFFALGLMSKPMLVTLPFVMLLLDYWPLQRMSWAKGRGSSETAASALDPRPATLGQLILEKWPFFLLSAASSVMTFFAQRGGEAVVSLARVSLCYRLENAPVAVGRYLLKMIWPADLAVIYPMPDKISAPTVAAAVAVLILISAAAWLTRWRSPYWLVGWLWFLGTLVPVIGLVQVGGAALADRYSYFPSIGVFLVAAFGFREMATRFQFPSIAGVAAAVLILGSCLWATERQLGFWRDSETLFRHALAATRDNEIAHVNLGVALERQGDLDEALAEYRAAATLAPGRYQIHNNLGNLLDKMGQPDQALAEYREAVRLKPELPSLHDGLGSVLAERGRFSEAMDEYTNAAQRDPTCPWPHFEMAKTLLQQGRDAEAVGQFREALRIDPDNFQILAYTARVLAAAENPQIRDGKAALKFARRANALTGGTQPLVLDALGMACAESGDFTNAQNLTQRALELATAARMKNLESLRQRLQLYQNHQPWRESFRFTNAPVKN
jgi:tetratricopeptide (TPR) repeat protein